ncbi:O-methylsterigmatocystin oxidoreductase, partial [Rhizoctonia solani AG-3 Rhs1AP]
MLNNWLNARAALQFHESHERHTRVLLKRLLNVPHKEHPFEAVENEFFLSAYGYRIQGHDDPFFRGATEAIEHLFSAHMYTNFWVNILPALSYVPDWVPGTGWKRTAKEWREQKNWTLNSTLQWTKDRVAEGSAEPSILGALLDHKLTSNWTQEDKEYRLKELGLVLFSGGTDTSSNVLVKFVAAMVLNPKVQAKAQEEIDRVLGSFKLPTIADEERLPAMSRDESIYKDPEVFNPDRFLDPKVPPLPGFGWGRRKCPGVYYARAAVFLSISSLLATFTFSKKIDSDGREVTPTIEDGSNSMTLGLKPFEFQFKPRSDRHKQLIAEMSSTSE